MRTKKIRITIWSILVASSLLAAAQISAQTTLATKPSTDAYAWHAELVALDETARQLTVKSPAFGEALTQLTAFKPGEKVVLMWSGFDKYANSVIGAHKFNAAKTPETRFAFPAEFVSLDSTRAYVTFKVEIPEASLARMKSVRPGEWVTATSAHGAAAYTHPIESVRGYNDLATGS